jgi:anti-sigma factor (TIGR02949 family)
MTELRAPRLTCKEVVELLSDYLEGTLQPGKRARVRAHLETCPECMAYLAQLRTTIGTLGRLREEDVPVPIRERLLAAFRTWRSG